jgi:hypothetical protein
LTPADISELGRAADDRKVVRVFLKKWVASREGFDHQIDELVTVDTTWRPQTLQHLPAAARGFQVAVLQDASAQNGKPNLDLVDRSTRGAYTGGCRRSDSASCRSLK